MPGWLTERVNPDLIQVVPIDDVIAHAVGDSCVCGPTPECIPSAAGDTWMWTHHSLDGRELTE